MSFDSSSSSFLRRGFDTVIYGGRVIDPLNGVDTLADVGITEGKIAAVVPASMGGLPSVAAVTRIDASGRLVCPGLVDLHVHVYEWITNFGVWADDAGIGVGATTIVDQGSSGPWTFGGMKAHVMDKAVTDVRAFVSVNVAGALMGGMKGDVLHNPAMTDVASVLDIIATYPERVRGIKCHGESGALSHWGTAVLEQASLAGRQARVPLYVHTGELFPIIEDSRPDPRSVLNTVLPLLKAGDVLAHVYSSMPDGIVGADEKVPEVIHRALNMGVHFDIGYGVNFSYRIARMLMRGGVYPNTISSDLHGDFNSFHDNSKLDYSLPGAMTRMWSLGMPLNEVIRATTINAARVLGEEAQLGSLTVGTVADVTLLEIRKGAWRLLDGRFDELDVTERLVPWLTLRRGVPYQPRPEMLPDLLNPLVAKPRLAA